MKPIFTLLLLALTVFAQDAAKVPASKTASLEFQNTLLTIQLLESQAREATARAQLLKADLPEQLKLIAAEKKIDLTKYQVLRDRNGNFELDENGCLQFVLKPTKGE